MNRRLISSGSTFEGEIGYSRAVVDGDWVFVSGTTGFDYQTMTLSPDVAEQCEQALRNVEAALTQAGASFAEIVRVVYILPAREDFAACWPALRRALGETMPAATMIEAGLLDPRAKFEIEVTARISRDPASRRRFAQKQEVVRQMPETDARKRHVISFYNLVFNQNQVSEAVEQYVGDEFVQHNPNIESGKLGFIKFFERMAREHPRKRVTVKRAFAEGDHIFLHCLQEWPGVQNFATIDIFRLNAEGKIVEHWDVMQAMPQRSNNPNGMF